jgi:hypothetical protein
MTNLVNPDMQQKLPLGPAPASTFVVRSLLLIFDFLEPVRWRWLLPYFFIAFSDDEAWTGNEAWNEAGTYIFFACTSNLPQLPGFEKNSHSQDSSPTGLALTIYDHGKTIRLSHLAQMLTSL